MGIDYGTRRIGIAVSDPGRTMAHPVTTVEVKSDGSHITKILELARTYNVSMMVIGMPYNMDGSMGPRAQQVRRWGEELAETARLPVEFWDERLSTFEAHDLLMRHEVRPGRRKRALDRIAAGVILQSYLDAKRS